MLGTREGALGDLGLVRHAIDGGILPANSGTRLQIQDVIVLRGWRWIDDMWVKGGRNLW